MCWLKAVLLEFAVLVTILSGVAGILFFFCLVSKADDKFGKGKPPSLALKRITRGLVLLSVLLGVSSLTVIAKNNVCARGFSGAWHSVWSDN